MKLFQAIKRTELPYRVRLSKETKEKMSKSKTGLKLSEESKSKITGRPKGILASNETKIKMSESWKNKRKKIECKFCKKLFYPHNLPQHSKICAKDKSRLA